MFSSIISALEAWAVYLIIGGVFLCMIVIVTAGKKRSKMAAEKEKKAWEENVKRNNAIQEQNEKAFLKQFDKKLESILTTRVNNVLKLYNNNKCTSVVENYLKSAFENRFFDLGLYVLPKAVSSFENKTVKFDDNKFKLEYSEWRVFINAKINNLIDEMRIGKGCNYDRKVALVEYLTYSYLSRIFVYEMTGYVFGDTFIKEIDKHDLKNMNNGIEEINSMYLGLTGLGVIRNFSLEDWYTFVGIKQSEFNDNTFDTLCDKYGIDIDAIDDEITDCVNKLFDLGEDESFNYLVSHPNIIFFKLIRDIIDKNGEDDLAEFMLLIVRHCSCRTCVDISKILLDAFAKIEKSKVKTSNLINGSKDEGHISIKDVDRMNGIEFEEFIADMFTKLGYRTEMTKASGDQGVDVIAYKGEKILGIQAKCYSGVVGNHAIMEVVAGKNYYGCNSCMVITNSTFSAAAKELAKANHVELWDRNALKDQIDLLDM